MNATTMQAALVALAQEEGIDAIHRAVLVLNGADWHTTTQLDVPPGIDLVFLPPASPELQPVERVWTLVDEPVANRVFADLDDLATVLIKRCRMLYADHAAIWVHIELWWWPADDTSPTAR